MLEEGDKVFKKLIDLKVFKILFSFFLKKILPHIVGYVVKSGGGSRGITSLSSALDIE